MTSSKKPEAKVFDNAVVAEDALTAIGGDALSASDIAALIEVPLPVATTILNDLVSSDRLLLGDDGLYCALSDPADGLDIIGPPITQEESDAAGAESLIGLDAASDPDSDRTVVYLPSSDIIAFLRNINLPSQFLVGFGVPARVNGFLAFESSSPTPDDPHPLCRFRVVLYGEHMNVSTPPNPNQSGYQNPTIDSTLADAGEGEPL